MKAKSQIETTQIILKFLDDRKISSLEDIVDLKNNILAFLKFRPYNSQTKKLENKMRWKRTASQVLKDGYVFKSKACTDVAVVFLALLKAAHIEGRLVRLMSKNKKIAHSLGHSIAEFKINGQWYRIDPSIRDSLPFKGALTSKSIWNKQYKIYKKGRDLWDIGLNDLKNNKTI